MGGNAINAAQVLPLRQLVQILSSSAKRWVIGNPPHSPYLVLIPPVSSGGEVPDGR
jgi:hypothetical protein